MINERILKECEEEHKRDVEYYKRFLHSKDNIQRAHAKSIVNGNHLPLMYAIRKELFEKKCDGLDGIEYVKNLFKTYGFDAIEYYKDDIHCIRVEKDNQIYANLTWSDLYNKVSMFVIK